MIYDIGLVMMNGLLYLNLEHFMISRDRIINNFTPIIDIDIERSFLLTTMSCFILFY